MDIRINGLFCIVYMVVALPAIARQAGQPIDEKTEKTTAKPSNNASVEGILLGTFQSASKTDVDGQDVDDEGNAQLYLFGHLDAGPGAWYLELRGSTSPRDQGVTRFYGEVNDSVGETLNASGHGRFAATQLYYGLALGPGELDVGLLDSTGILDANDIADDEYTQFLGTSFVNNPSIDYPSFALAVYYNGEISRHLSYKFFVSSSGGLDDEDDPTYGNVVDVGEQGKGAFTAGQLTWQAAGLNGDVGIWYDSSDHADLNYPADNDRDSYGAYTSAGGPLAGGQWVGWAGIANDEVSSAANFLALAYAHDFDDVTLGAGISRIGVSDEQPAPAASIIQAELYLRFNVALNIYVTPDLQYVANSGFDPRRDTIVEGLRAGIEF